jgi:RNA-directed DNA polymerase
MEPLNSVRKLAWLAGTTPARLRAICKDLDRDKLSHYRFWSEPDKHKSHVLRQFRAPTDELKAIQRNLVRNLFRLVPAHESAHGGVKGRSPSSNAEQHLAQPWLINLDVPKFFPSVRHYVLADALSRYLRCGREVTWMLTRLITLEAQLPQGAPTSTAAANFLLKHAVDEVISARAAEIGVVNTRYVDDVSLSGAEPRPLINVTARALSRCRLSIHRPSAKSRGNPKFRITPNSKRQIVTGLTVNSKAGPSVPKSYRDEVRATIHRLPPLTSSEFATAVSSINGKIEYIRRTNPGSADRLRRYLESVARTHGRRKSHEVHR